MTSKWKKIIGWSMWTNHIPDMGVTQCLSIEAATDDHKRRYVLTMFHGDRELVDFHKYLGTYPRNMRRYFPTKDFKTVTSVQERINNLTQKYRMQLYYHTQGIGEIDTLIAKLDQYFSVAHIDRNELINRYVTTDAIKNHVARLDELDQMIAVEKQKHARDLAIWDSLNERYKNHTNQVYVGTDIETVMVKSGWREGYTSANPSDYQDGWVYVPPAQVSSDEYQTISVDRYVTVMNDQYIEPPATPSGVESLQQELYEKVRLLSAHVLYPNK